MTLLQGGMPRSSAPWVNERAREHAARSGRILRRTASEVRPRESSGAPPTTARLRRAVRRPAEHQDRDVVALLAELLQRRVDPAGDRLGVRRADGAQQRLQALGAEPAVGPARVGDAVGVEDERVAGAQRDVGDRPAALGERAEQRARPPDRSHLAVGRDQQRRRMPGADDLQADARRAVGRRPHARRRPRCRSGAARGRSRASRSAAAASRSGRPRTGPRCASCSAPAT